MGWLGGVKGCSFLRVPWGVALRAGGTGGCPRGDFLEFNADQPTVNASLGALSRPGVCQGALVASPVGYKLFLGHQN